MKSVADVLGVIKDVVSERLKEDINYDVFNELMAVSSRCLNPLTDDFAVWGVNFDALDGYLRDEFDLFMSYPNIFLLFEGDSYITLAEWIDFIVAFSSTKGIYDEQLKMRDDRIFVKKVMLDFICFDFSRLQRVLQEDFAKDHKELNLSLSESNGYVVANIFSDNKPVNGIFWKSWIKKLEKIKIVN